MRMYRGVKVTIFVRQNLPEAALIVIPYTNATAYNVRIR